MADYKDLERQYREFFNSDGVLDHNDKRRLDFIEMVITGKATHIKKQGITETIECLKRKGASPASALILYFKTAETFRHWYENPRKAGFAEMKAAVEMAGTECDFLSDKLERCDAFLRNYRLTEIINQFREAIQRYSTMKANKDRAATVQQVSSLINQARAFRSKPTLEAMVTIGAHDSRQGLYPKTIDPAGYARRVVRDAVREERSQPLCKEVARH